VIENLVAAQNLQILTFLLQNSVQKFLKNYQNGLPGIKNIAMNIVTKN